MELRKPMLNRVHGVWTLEFQVETCASESPDVTLVLTAHPMEEPSLELFDDGQSWTLLNEEEKQFRITGIVGQRMCSREEAEDLLYGEMEIRMIDAASEDYGLNFTKIRQEMLDWWLAINVMINLAS